MSRIASCRIASMSVLRPTNDACDDIAMPADIFRRGMHDEIGTEDNRTLQEGSRKRVVDNQNGTAAVAQAGNRSDVEDSRTSDCSEIRKRSAWVRIPARRPRPRQDR